MIYNLREIILNCEKEADQEEVIRISDKFKIGETFKFFGYEKNWMLHNNYYKYLISFCKILQPQRVLELGTQIGSGAAALSVYSRSVVTADVNIGEISKEIYLSNKISVISLRTPQSCLNINFSPFELIFIDIGHDGIYEEQIHKKLLESKYKGIVLWDDILLNNSMKKFWNELDGVILKTETNWHGECGFGICEY